MALFVAVFVFIYGIIEKDFWWALWASAAAFFVSFVFEFTYAVVAFTAMFNTISAFLNLITTL